MDYDISQIKAGSFLETEEQLFSERNLMLGILWERDVQFHNKPRIEKAPSGSTIIYGNSVISDINDLGRLLRTCPKYPIRGGKV
jgi:hypothetical protein